MKGATKPANLNFDLKFIFNEKFKMTPLDDKTLWSFTKF